MINPVNLLLVLLVVVVCSACSSDQASMPTQTWQDLTVEVQTRPPQIVEGMNEFLIIVSTGRRPAADLILSIKIKGRNKWHQSIQDGRVGVYRRALSVKNKQQDVLLVHIRRAEGGIILEFPLAQQSVKSANKN